MQIALRYIEPRPSAQPGAALQMLGVILHSPTAHWPADPKLTAYADKVVLKAAPRIIAYGQRDALPPLALYLGGIKTDRARELLWDSVQRPEHEQALTVLAWVGDPRDLPRLGELLITPGDPDSYGRDRAGLPYSLMRGYGDRAIPFLEKALVASPYPFVRTASARELALRGRPAAFRFFLDAVENDKFYNVELVNRLKDYFPNQVPRQAEDREIIAFPKSRLAGR